MVPRFTAYQHEVSIQYAWCRRDIDRVVKTYTLKRLLYLHSWDSISSSLICFGCIHCIIIVNLFSFSYGTSFSLLENYCNNFVLFSIWIVAYVSKVRFVRLKFKYIFHESHFIYISDVMIIFSGLFSIMAHDKLQVWVIFKLSS